MKLCPRCGKKFEKNGSLCDVDGARLMDSSHLDRYETMSKIFGAAMEETFGRGSDPRVFFDLDEKSWDGLFSVRWRKPGLSKSRLVASVILFCANQSALNFYDRARSGRSANHLPDLIEFLCLYCALLKRTALSKLGFGWNSWGAWWRFLADLRREEAAQLNFNRRQMSIFWNMFMGRLRAHDSLYGSKPLRRSVGSDKDVLSEFGRLMQSQMAQSSAEVVSTASTAALVGANVVPKIIAAFDRLGADVPKES